MKNPTLFIYGMSALLLISCGKNSGLDSGKNKSTSIQEAALVQSTSQSSSSESLIQLMLDSNAALSSENLEKTISAHNENKITNFEFRSLFWQNLSNEALDLFKDQLQKDKSLSKLDQLLIDSLKNNNVTLLQLIEELKLDDEELLPTSLQLKLLTELNRLYLRDFDQLNSLPFQNNLGRILDFKGGEAKEKIFKQIRTQLEAVYFKNLLSNKRLITAPNNNLVGNQDIKGKFNFSYNLFLGRCDPVSGNISFESLNQNFGRYCSYNGGGTDTTSDLFLVSETSSFGEIKKFDLVVRSFARGGYQKSRGENETSRVNYNLNGSIVIPQCSNPNLCKQIITISIAETNQMFTDAATVNSGISATVNGTPLNLKMGTVFNVDVSQKEAVINISMSTSKSHVGACCYNAPEQQRLSLMIDSSGMMIPNQILTQFEVFPFFSPQEFSGVFESEEEGWRRIINTPSVPNEYRRVLYDQLRFLHKNLELQMTSQGNPLSVTSLRGKIQRLSDKLGRDLVLPVVNSKLQAFQQAKSLLTQTKVNELVQLILLKAVDNQIATDELKGLLYLKEKELNKESAEVIQKFIESIKTQNNDINEILKNVSILKTDLELSAMNINLELEILNLEKAQFEKINE